MNILIVPSWYKTKSNPTLGSFFYEQARMLKQRGHSVLIADVTLQGRKDSLSGRCYKLYREDNEGIIVYSYVIPAFGRFNRDDGGSNAVFKNIEKVYRRILKDGFDIDIVHAHSYLPAGIAAVRFFKQEGIPVVVTEHASDLLSVDINTVRTGLLSETLNSCDSFVCVSNKLKESVQKLTKCDSDKIKVIPNVVDDIFTYELHKGDRDGFTFVSIGNLIETKRFDLTIEAFSKAFSKDKNVRLKIVGEGPLRKQLEEQVKAIGEDGRISFYGRISREAIVDQLNTSNCMVLPSDFETFGVVYIEAMAVGLPVIGTRNGGAEDIINEENGILVDKNNVDQLRDAMQNMYCMIDSFDNEFIARSTKQKYGSDVLGREFESLYNALIDSRRNFYG